MTTLPDLLSEIKSRADKATGGPWHSSKQYKMNMLLDSDGGIIFRKDGILREDLKFIAHAREDVPRLLTALQFMIDVLDPEEFTTNECIIERLERILQGKTE